MIDLAQLDPSVFLTAHGWIALIWLTVMEIVLGIDNIIIISILSGELPTKEQQRKARRILITEWQDASGRIEKRDENCDLGGTMRLGGQLCQLGEGTMAREIYRQAEIVERHRHRYEVNSTLLGQLQANGLVVSGRAPVTDLCEIIELPKDGSNAHPWFLGCQFHPEFTSSPRRGHPLFTSFVQAATAYRAKA